jgi:glycosyltransferase involved in cell wall biosynthesis
VSAVRPTRIDQVVHVLAGHDAIGTHVLGMRTLLRSMGFASEVFAGATQPEVRHEARPIDELGPARSGAWLVFHHSIGTAVADVVLRRPEPLVLDYHNITPASLVGRWAPSVRAELALGREQLAQLAPRARFGIAHSRFSEDELEAAGCPRTAAAAPFCHLSVPEPDRGHARRGTPSHAGARWLFVGRISPHKAEHDLIKALACYRLQFDPEARLTVVGTALGELYPRALERFADRLGVRHAVSFPGVVSEAELQRAYADSDVFVCTSDHEGFCVPLVEAMAHGLPVVAYAAAAVGETVADGGLVLRDKAPMTVATAVARVLTDDRLRARLVDAGRRRAAGFTDEACAARLRAAIGRALAVEAAAVP